MTKATDLTYWRFGKLRALTRYENDVTGKAQWVCACDCGGAHIVRSDHLTSGSVKKCPACARVREPLTVHAWYHVTLIEANGGYVQGSAGFIEMLRGEQLVYRSPWIEDRHIARRESPVVLRGVRGAAHLGAIRCAQYGAAIGSWVRRNKDRFTWHSFSEGEQVWAAWYARTKEWKGPQQDDATLADALGALRMPSGELST